MNKIFDSKPQMIIMFELTKQTLLNSISIEKFGFRLLQHQQIELVGKK